MEPKKTSQKPKAHPKKPNHFLRERFFQKKIFTDSVGGLLCVAYQFWSFLSGGIVNLQFVYVAVAVYVLGAGCDIWSTWRVMGYKAEFDKRGVEFLYVEANRYLPDYPTLRELIISTPTWVTLAVIPVGLFLPGVLFGSGIGGFLRAANNLTNEADARYSLYLVTEHWEKFEELLSQKNAAISQHERAETPKLSISTHPGC